MRLRTGCDWDDEDEFIDPADEAEHQEREQIMRYQALVASSRARAAAAAGAATAVARAATTAAEQARAARIAETVVERALANRSPVVSYADVIAALDGTARAGRIAARATRNINGGSDTEAAKAMIRAAAQLADDVSLVDFASLAVRVDQRIGGSVNMAFKTAQAAATAASTAAFLASRLSLEADQYDSELTAALQVVAVSGIVSADAVLGHPSPTSMTRTKQSSIARQVTDLIAVRLLPPQHRERYAEEWAAEIGALADGGRSRTAQVTYALGLSVHAVPLRVELSRPQRRRTPR